MNVRKTDRVLKDLGYEKRPVLAIDAKATEHILHRQGIAKLKHIDVAYLCIQDEVRSHRLRRVRSEDNIADLGTKPLSKAVIAKHCLTMGYVNMSQESAQKISHSWRDPRTSIQQTAVQKAISSKPQQRKRPQQRQRTGPGLRSRRDRWMSIADCDDTSDDPEQHFTPPIDPNKRRSTRAQRKAQYHDGGDDAWQEVRGGAASESRRHRFGYRLLLHVHAGER